MIMVSTSICQHHLWQKTCHR